MSVGGDQAQVLVGVVPGLLKLRPIQRRELGAFAETNRFVQQVGRALKRLLPAVFGPGIVRMVLVHHHLDGIEFGVAR